jgi:NAD dependent epimerase/dehydratase family enzyme
MGHNIWILGVAGLLYTEILLPKKWKKHQGRKLVLSRILRTKIVINAILHFYRDALETADSS